MIEYGLAFIGCRADGDSAAATKNLYRGVLLLVVQAVYGLRGGNGDHGHFSGFGLVGYNIHYDKNRL